MRKKNSDIFGAEGNTGELTQQSSSQYTKKSEEWQQQQAPTLSPNGKHANSSRDAGGGDYGTPPATNISSSTDIPSSIKDVVTTFPAPGALRVHSSVVMTALSVRRPKSATRSLSRDSAHGLMAAELRQVADGGSGPPNLYRASSQPVGHEVSRRYAKFGHLSPRQQQQQQQQKWSKGKLHPSRGKHRLGSRAGRLQPVIRRSQSTNSLKHLAMQFAQDAQHPQNGN